MRSVAASVALGGHGLDCSELRVEADVEEGGELRWLPEPTIATAGCYHRAVSRIRLATDARLVWRDELILGRHGEGPGRLVSRIEVEAGGIPLARQELRVGQGAPGWQGPAVSGGAGAIGVVVVVEPGERREASLPAQASPAPVLAVLALAGRGAMVSAVAPDAFELRCRLDAGVATLA